MRFFERFLKLKERTVKVGSVLHPDEFHMEYLEGQITLNLGLFFLIIIIIK